MYSIPKELQIYTYIDIVNICIFLYLCSRKFYLFYSFPHPQFYRKKVCLFLYLSISLHPISDDSKAIVEHKFKTKTT
jgi:hypothetical protein